MDSKKRLVMVVHGVGEQAPGETLRSFTGAVVNNAPAKIISSEIEIRENYDDADPRLHKAFPCHTTHVTENATGRETLFSEVYWADLSQGPKGYFATILEFVKTVLGLGYIVRANVREVHDPNSLSQTRDAPPLRKTPMPVNLADIFVWLAHGLNAVLNMILAIGVLLAFAAYQFIPEAWHETIAPIRPHAIMGLCALASVAVGWRFRPTNRLFRQFCDGAFFVGLMGLALTLVGIVMDRTGALTGTPLNFYVHKIVTLMQFSWGLMFLMAARLVLGFGAKPITNTTRVYPHAIAAMVVFWMILSCTFWIAFGKWASSNDAVKVLFDANLLQALGMLPMAMLSLILLLVFGGAEAWRRKTWANDYKTEFEGKLAQAPAQDAQIPRLLLNEKVGLLLLACLLVMALCAVLIAVNRWFVPLPVWLVFWDPSHSLNQASYIVAAGLGTVIIIAWGLVQTKLAVGLGVGKDVINYFVDTVDKCPPWQSAWALFSKNEEPPDFRIRNRIDNRFSIILENFARSFEPDEIIVVSHSQGTMISIQSLNKDQNLAHIQNKRFKLFTMGSPYTHLYRYYFASQFKFEQIHPDIMANWVNIYRVDDFVGTHIETRLLDDGTTAPKNVPVHPDGHTGYWFDQQVLDVLASEAGLDFELAAPQRKPSTASSA